MKVVEVIKGFNDFFMIKKATLNCGSLGCCGVCCLLNGQAFRDASMSLSTSAFSSGRCLMMMPHMMSSVTLSYPWIT